MASSFFMNLFSKDQAVEPNQLLGHVDVKVPEVMDESPCKDFSDNEIAEALFQIGPLKAPSPDGLPARFFQRNWEVVRDDVIAAVRQFFVCGQMPDAVSETSTILIPKTNTPYELKGLSPHQLVQCCV